VPAQLPASAFIMFIQKMTLWASTVWPSWNFHPFKVNDDGLAAAGIRGGIGRREGVVRPSPPTPSCPNQ